MEKLHPDNIMIGVGGKWGDAKLTLTEWIKNGPNKRYLLQGPGRAWHKYSGNDIPLQEIPYPFRNDEYAVRLILDGLVDDPWNRNREELLFLIELLINYDTNKHYEIIKLQFLEELSQSEKSEETLYEQCWKIVRSSSEDREANT